MFKGRGICLFAPNRKPRHTNEWWMYVECDPQIGKYYRHLYQLKNYSKISSPRWPTHISAIKAERPSERKAWLWGLYEGMKVEFFYSHEVTQFGIYFALTVYSDAINKIRNELGLCSRPEFHITIGNVKDHQ